ncbi:type II toxin-antitoxin system RelE/ParE family toxin [Yersinia thracica]|uniref:type II toxin-antitoxin system RelE/ParE family toxin n=1 Tax=Yersinia thracica TaxID=2890319 RepID=UPI0011A31141|nr:type II toxin-antitoxin system RelE/ParE family toxin [Yersinia thracica]
MYQTEYYQDKNEKKPFKIWLDKLRKKEPRAAAKIDVALDRAEAGNFGFQQFARDGVWEIKIEYATGYRIYYSIENGKIILLLIGGTKKSQDSDINKAVKYLADYKKRSKP